MKAPPTSNPQNRFVETHLEYQPESEDTAVPLARVQVIDDASKSIVARNDSPDIGFSYSVNPYRGCNHSCAYCYARPTHEYLGYGAGTDFDTKIVVKHNAAQLLREHFERPSWTGDVLMFSGVTDCYQPLESKLKLTRSCLQVCAEYKNPVALITKSPLIERDLDVLLELQHNATLRVAISIPIFDESLSRAIEPGVATPARRLRTIETLSRAGVNVGVMVAPIIPAVSDEKMGEVLEAAREAGATSAGYVLLRLPHSVKQVFEERIRAALPLRADKILHRIRETRDGKLYDAAFHTRGRGTGKYAEAVAAVFEATTRRLKFAQNSFGPWRPTFSRPAKQTPQLSFGL
jgi:DNA repair photolyase